MVVCYFNIVRIVVVPAEAYTPLVVDANAPLAHTVAFQRLQAAAGKHGQVFQPTGIVQHTQLPQSHGLHGVIQPPGKPAVPDAFCLFAGKARDHGPRLGRAPEKVNVPEEWRFGDERR